MLGAGGFCRSVLGHLCVSYEACGTRAAVCLAGCFHKFVTGLYEEGKPVIYWQASLIKLRCNATVWVTEKSQKISSKSQNFI